MIQLTDVDGNFTEGFPKRNGLIKIDDEIISYESKTDTTFEGCVRGFSGITSYTTDMYPIGWIFNQCSQVITQCNHSENLNVLFLQSFSKN